MKNKDNKNNKDFPKHSKNKRHKNMKAENLLIILDENARILSTNKLCEKLGYTQKELKGKSLEELIDTNAEELTKDDPHDIVIHGKNGKSIYCKYEWLEHKNTTILSLIDMSSYSKLNNTVRKLQNKLQEAQLQIQQTELFAGLTHDLKNKLIPITGFSEVLELRIKKLKKILNDNPLQNKEDEEKYNAGLSATIKTIEQNIATIHESGSEAFKIINYFARIHKRKLKHQTLKLSTIVDQTVTLCRQELDKINISKNIKINIHPNHETIVGNEAEMYFLISNLIRNAKQAIENQDEKEITITSYAEKHKEGYLIMEITDNGPGIPPQIRDKVFRPCFTTKKTGTGLGLDFCEKIAKKHNGALYYDHEYDKGARFKIILPEVDPNQEETKLIIKPNQKNNSRKKVLIIENQDYMRQLYEQVLTEDGYQIHSTCNISEALIALDKNKNYDAILCNLHLHDSGTSRVYKKIKEYHPDYAKKLIITSQILSKDSSYLKGLRDAKLFHIDDAFDSFQLSLTVYSATKTKLK